MAKVAKGKGKRVVTGEADGGRRRSVVDLEGWFGISQRSENLNEHFKYLLPHPQVFFLTWPAQAGLSSTVGNETSLSLILFYWEMRHKPEILANYQKSKFESPTQEERVF